MTTEKIMCVNAGSSSLKFKLYEVESKIKNSETLKEKAKHLKTLTSGLIEKIGHDDAIFNIRDLNGEKHSDVFPIKDHQQAVDLLLKALLDYKIINSMDEISGIGHRIVQGGALFSDSAIFDDDAYKKIESLTPIDPLHAPAHLTCFRAFKNSLPNVGEVAIFDTSFHTTMEEKEYIYPIPYQYYEKYQIRRYGAHGTSHKYLSTVAIQEYLNNSKHSKIITCHIGSGASLAAVKDGKCIATSMGLTPLAGVMMGTRCGDIDPSIMPYLVKCGAGDSEKIYDVFNKESGLLGISQISNDTRDVEKAAHEGNKKAILALDMFASKIADYIMMYYGKLKGCDLIVCSAGVFENSSYIREKTFDLLKEALNIKIDKKKNEQTIRGKEGFISKKDSNIPVLVLPTDEELMIALDTLRILKM